MKRVEGKVAIVTGASSGIERAIAKLFAQEGAKVVLASTTASKGHQVEDEIKSQGGEAFFIQTDVTSSLDLECLVKTTLDKYGQIDIFVNNAGIPDDIDENITEERLHRIMGVNFNGPFLLSRTVISHMKKQGSGNIINVISVGGMQSTRRACVYSATKAGMNMMTRNMARMHGKYNIRVNCVAPSQNETSIWWQSLDREPTQEEVEKERAARAASAPMGRVGKPEEVAYPVLFLASDESSYVNGVILPIDGGKLA